MYSLNEIDVTAKRAARGAGLPWGIAEEAGKSARYLEANGLPGAETTLALLNQIDGTDCRENCPDTSSPVWTATSGALCPLMSGTALSDLANTFSTNVDVNLGAMLSPLLFVPFVAMVASRMDPPIEVSWPGAKIIVSDLGLSIEGSKDALTASRVENVRCMSCASVTIHNAVPVRAPISAKAWSALGDLGHRTFAPDTEASRLSGAVAGLSDND